MDRVGRVPVLAAGFGVGAAGCGLTALGSSQHSTSTLLAGLVGLGASSGITRLARVAAGDMYSPQRRARGIALVLFGAVFGLGWNLSLVAATAELADRTGPSERGSLLGFNDLLSGATAAGLTLPGGLVLTMVGIQALAIGSLALVLSPALWILRGGRRPLAYRCQPHPPEEQRMRVSPRVPSTFRPPWLVWAALLVIYLVWGSTYLAIRVSVRTLPPLMTAGARFLIAGAITYAVLRLHRGRGGVRVQPRELAASAAIGTALLLGGVGLVSIAERDVPSGLAALIIASVPLWVVVLRSVFADRVGWATLVGVLAGFIGVAILVMPGEHPDGASLAGMLLLVGAAASWAVGSFFSRRVPLPKDPFVSTAMEQMTGGVVLLLVSLMTGELADFRPGQVSAESALGFWYLVVFGSLLAFTAYTWLLQNAPIQRVATYAYVNPVVAIVLGWLILSEEITGTILLGAAVIVSSVAFIVRRESASEPEEERSPIEEEAA
jgi:drug/metabolite transporter (DMT)-like permease